MFAGKNLKLLVGPRQNSDPQKDGDLMAISAAKTLADRPEETVQMILFLI
jgi:hypothetical protein